MDKIKYVPNLIADNGKPIKSKDIQTSIANDIANLDDHDFKITAHTRLTRLNKAITAVLKDGDYKDDIANSFEEVAKLDNSKKVTVEGAELTHVATYTKYDFSECNHPVLDFLNEVTVKFKDIKKDLEAEIKLIPQLGQEIDTDRETGEVITKTTGGSKKMFIDPDEVVGSIKFVIDYAQHLIDNIEENKGMFVVNAVDITKSMGIKVNKG